MLSYYHRTLEKIISKNLPNVSAIYLNGPRQAGKSTLIKKIATESLNASYVTFDDPFIRANALRDPKGFLEQFKGSLILDEIQRVPLLFDFLKMRIDEYREKGFDKEHKLILTGSTNLMSVPQLAKALVGRIILYTLYPFSSPEVKKTHCPFLKDLFEASLSFNTYPEEDIIETIKESTFPELFLHKQTDQTSWFHSYIGTILERELNELSDIRQVEAIPQLLQVLASRAGSLLNDADLARTLQLDNNTLKRYRILLECVFLLFQVPPWFHNLGKRLIKSPKVYFTDTLLLSSLLHVDLRETQRKNPVLFGHLLENFIATELRKGLATLPSGALYHFRTPDQREVDFVVQNGNQEILGIEVKATHSLHPKDASSLVALRELTKDLFKKGIIFYTGNTLTRIREDIWAVPIQVLWNGV